MRITIAMGFFLPMPPVAGGATEKSWHALAAEFARRGHEVTVVSKTHPDWPASETIDGVHHQRVRGADQTVSLRRNLWRDFRWSLSLSRVLPCADVTVVNCVALPVWLRRVRRRVGRVVVMPGRMPRGQYRFYGAVDRVLAVSTPVRGAVIAENPRLAPITTVHGYPIDWTGLAGGIPERPSPRLTIGYVGRIHREKGLETLASALVRLHADPTLPLWRAVFCGPVEVARGGSGEEYRRQLVERLAVLPPEQFEWRPAQFAGPDLARTYREMDIFCYPSVAAGETFGVAVAEAMATGAIPVVSGLPCFADFVRDGATGLVCDHRGSDAADRLAGALARLLRDRTLREHLAGAAREEVRRFDLPVYADRLLREFSALL